MGPLIVCCLLVLSALDYSQCQLQLPQEQMVVLNDLFDLLLSGLEDELRYGGRNLARLPDSSKTWSKELGPLKLSASVDCTDGRVASVRSIRRDGNVTLWKNVGQVTLRAPLRIHELNVAYDKCVLKVAGIKFTDPLQLLMTRLSLVTQISMKRTKDGCTNELGYMVITNIGSLTAEMGSGLRSNIKEAILHYFARKNNNKILNSLNEKLQTGAARALVRRNNLCQNIFFYVRN